MPDDWIAVGLSADVPVGTVVPAHLPTGILALWRSASGKLTASADRCPHRGMRLSYGFVRGEALSCIYHGWSYASDGRCLRIPAHPGLTPPDAVKVATFRTGERDGVIWISTGNPGSLPPALEGFEPLRSLTVCVPDVGDLPAELAGVHVKFLLSPTASGETLVHVLVTRGAPPAGRVAVSRALEGWRRELENARSGALSS